MQIAQLTITEFEDFFYEITRDYAITCKRLSNIKNVLNGIMQRCVSRKIIPHNILSDVDMKVFKNRCKPTNSDKDNYSLEERQSILDYLSNKADIYSLAIRFAFYLPLRISEICAIKYSDIKDVKLHLQRANQTEKDMDDNLTFSNRKITNDERLMGNKETDFRVLPLTISAAEIAELAYNLYPKYEYLFMRNDAQLIPDTFNEELQKVCKHLDIKYRSSHQIRFTVATLLYENGMPINELSSLLGHSNTAMT